ncbi:hypothetical protein [Neisseria gonorrhoeae]|uniref:hypothetical protein n=1 Tax=Neisseria gonorrhoeae TaxID=485 RepID=UPI00280419DE|nr:hypothetical protein [Neisseria gonorrhoeae]
MNLKALIARFRVLANDKAEPYFWSDEEVSGWLNDAVHEACLRGRLLHSDDAFVTDVEKGRPLYAYAAGGFAAGYAYEIDSIRFVSDANPGRKHPPPPAKPTSGTPASKTKTSLST